jgi:predicted ABC-type sugar transport system permease subunit
MSTETKIALGSALAALGALAIVLSVLLEWTAVPAPWDVLLGFVLGVITGLGGTLAVAGLIERRRAG